MATQKKPLYLPENDLDKLAPYLLESGSAIGKLLTQMVDSRSLISLYSIHDPNLFVISRLLSATETDLEFDLQTDEERTRFLETQQSGLIHATRYCIAQPRKPCTEFSAGMRTGSGRRLVNRRKW